MLLVRLFKIVGNPTRLEFGPNKVVFRDRRDGSESPFGSDTTPTAEYSSVIGRFPKEERAAIDSFEYNL